MRIYRLFWGLPSWLIVFDFLLLFFTFFLAYELLFPAKGINTRPHINEFNHKKALLFLNDMEGKPIDDDFSYPLPIELKGNEGEKNRVGLEFLYFGEIFVNGVFFLS